MHLFTHSALLRALGWSLFNSLWQMALVWLLYIALTAIFRRASSHARHGLAILLLGAGSVWAGASFIVNFFFSGGNPDERLSGSFQSSSWLNGFFSGDLSGQASLSLIRHYMDEALPYCTAGYLLAL